MTQWRQTFVRTRTGQRSTSLRELFQECSEEERRLSSAFHMRHLAGNGAGALTPFAGIERGPGPLASRPATGSTNRDLRACLSDVLASSIADAPEAAVAVSGGVDSWMLAALLQSLGYSVRGYYLESGVPGYCERDQVRRFAETLGVPCEHIRVTAQDFIHAAPEFVRITETPIYNLHPVSKLLLAKALAARGVRAVVTGDGADQVMRCEWDCDLLPLTLTCFRAAGVIAIAPFIHESIVAWCAEPYPDKRPIRELARSLGVPDSPKRPAHFPEVDLPRDYSCLAYTIHLLLEAMEAHPPCVALRV